MRSSLVSNWEPVLLAAAIMSSATPASATQVNGGIFSASTARIAVTRPGDTMPMEAWMGYPATKISRIARRSRQLRLKAARYPKEKSQHRMTIRKH